MNLPVAPLSPSRAREALLAAAIASTDDGVVVIDAASRIVLFNTGAERMFGWSELEVLGQPLETLIPAPRRERHAALVLEFGGGSVNSRRMSEREDVLALHRDGTEFPVAASITRVRIDGSTFFVAIIRDVSARQRAADMLAAKTRQLQTIAEAMTTFLGTRDWGTASQTLVQGALAETQSEYGFAGVVVDGSALRILAHAGIIWHDTENRAFYENALREYRERGYLEFTNFNNLFGLVITSGHPVLSNDPAHHPHHGGLPGGHPPLASFLGVPIISGTETVGMIAVANRPGGYGVQQQAALELLAQMAGVLFDSYRRWLRQQHLEEQLRQSQKMEALGQLAGGIAHDFNNILTVILGYCALADDVPTREDLLEIRTAASRAAALVSQLLAFSRRQVIRPRRFDLNAVAAGTAAMLRRMIGEHVKIVLDLDEALASVEADPHQIEQVLMNLAVNARDAMPAGGELTIQVRNVSRNVLGPVHLLTRPPEQERFVLFRVRDTGEGMDEQTRARIFDPFFTTKELGRGTGLGLSTVYGVVYQLGGTISVDSEIGRGSVFEICLPWKEGPLAPLQAAPGGPRVLTGSETILVVEDEPQLLALVVRTLREHGYAVLQANNPGKALRVAREHPEPIDLVVSDVVMPQMNGVDLFECIKVFHPESQVCFMSGYSYQGNEILETGAVLLEKPFAPVTLLTTVRKMLDRAGDALP